MHVIGVYLAGELAGYLEEHFTSEVRDLPLPFDGLEGVRPGHAQLDGQGLLPRQGMGKSKDMNTVMFREHC